MPIKTDLGWYRIEVTLPSKDKDGKPIDTAMRNTWLVILTTDMAQWYGGVTHHRAFGIWLDDKGEPVHEQVTIVMSYAPRELALQYAEHLDALVHTMKARLDQDTAMYAIIPVDTVQLV